MTRVAPPAISVASAAGTSAASASTTRGLHGRTIAECAKLPPGVALRTSHIQRRRHLHDHCHAQAFLLRACGVQPCVGHEVLARCHSSRTPPPHNGLASHDCHEPGCDARSWWCKRVAPPVRSTLMASMFANALYTSTVYRSSHSRSVEIHKFAATRFSDGPRSGSQGRIRG